MRVRVVLSDSSCLIDLQKASLLDAFLRLPYEIVMPNTLFEDGLLRFTSAQQHALIEAGVHLIDIPGNGVLRVREIARANPRLPVVFGFAFVVAESNEACVLVTDDQQLRELAEHHKIAVHGVLWIVDELHRRRVVQAPVLVAALRWLAQNGSLSLPRREIMAAIRRYQAID